MYWTTWSISKFQLKFLRLMGGTGTVRAPEEHRDSQGHWYMGKGMKTGKETEIPYDILRSIHKLIG